MSVIYFSKALYYMAETLNFQIFQSVPRTKKLLLLTP